MEAQWSRESQRWSLWWLYVSALVSHFSSENVQTLSAFATRRALGGAHLPPTKVFRRLTGSVNKTVLKALLPTAANTFAYVYVGFSWCKILCSSAELIWAQKLISPSMFRHLLTRNILCKSMHSFFSNLRHIKFHRNPSITSSDKPLKCKNPV